MVLRFVRAAGLAASVLFLPVIANADVPGKKLTSAGEVTDCIKDQMSSGNVRFDHAQAFCAARATPKAYRMFKELANAGPTLSEPQVVTPARNPLRFVNPNVEGPLATPLPR